MRSRKSALAGLGAISDFIVPAPLLAVGTLPGKLFVPTAALYGVELPLYIYISANLGAANDGFVGVTALGTYLASNPNNCPFYVWAPQLPLAANNNYNEVGKAIFRGINQLDAAGYRINRRAITAGGYSAGGSYFGRLMYSFMWNFAGFCWQSISINRNNLTSTASMNGEEPSGFIMNPATVLTDANCWDLYVKRAIGSGCRFLMNFGDPGSDPSASVTGLGMGTAFTNNGCSLTATTSATYGVNDPYVQNQYIGADHGAMQTHPWTGQSALDAFAWINAARRPAFATKSQPW